MGYRFKSKTYRLVFGDDLEGLEVVCRSGTVQQFLAVSELDTDDATNALKNMNNFSKLCSAFVASLVSWNLEDEVTDRPVPANLSGLFSQDVDLVLRVISAWMDAIAAKSPESAREDGAPSEAVADLLAGLPMEVLG